MLIYPRLANCLTQPHCSSQPYLPSTLPPVYRNSLSLYHLLRVPSLLRLPRLRRCYSSLTSSWYISLFLLAPLSLALRYVLLRLDTYFNPFEFLELLFCRTLTRAVLFPLLPDGTVLVDSFLLRLILDSSPFRPILSYRTRIPYYSSILACSMKFYAYASSSISRQLPVP